MAKTLDQLPKDIGRIPEEINKRLSQAKLKSTTDIILDEIVKRVLNGEGVDSMGGNPKKFPGLAKATVEYRKYLKDKGLLSSFTEVDKDNQTATGKMLESLEVREVKGGVEIIITDPSRQKVYEYQEEKRPWLYLSNDEIKILTDEVEKSIDDAFSVFFEKG